MDWIVATGANLYHDLHFAFNFPLHVGSHLLDDTDLRKNDIVRIYDVLLGYSDCLMATDEILRGILVQPEFQKEMGTAELHYLLGPVRRRVGAQGGPEGRLRAGRRLPLRRALLHLVARRLDDRHERGRRGAARATSCGSIPSIDVNETTSFVLAAKRSGGKSGVMLMGGGSPKNFMLQTEPQIQEVLRIKEVGQDYFFQVTDARPDTGGLVRRHAARGRQLGQGRSRPGCPTPWSATRTRRSPCRSSRTTPLANHKPRKLKRLYDQRPAMMEALVREYFAHNK